MPEEYTGAVVDLLSRRKGEMLNMSPVETGGDAQTTSIEYLVPTRGMIGLRNSMLTATRGTAVMDTIFDSYRPYAGKSIYGGAHLSPRIGTLLQSLPSKHGELTVSTVSFDTDFRL